MSVLEAVTVAILLVGVAIFIVGVITLIVLAQRRSYNAELSPSKSSPAGGVLYAFTLAMAPWAKESARKHWIAYMRGIIFHLGIFVGAAYLIATPWLSQMPQTLRLSLSALFAVAAILGLAGFGMRLADPAMRLLSTPDDYFSLALTTLFLASAAISAAWVGCLPALWAISGITLAYVPFGKLRHFLYFFYVRVFLGLVFGRRGVLEQ